MRIDYGNGPTYYGPGIDIQLTGDEVATAVSAYLVAHGVYVSGPRTITVNGQLCELGSVYVDPSGFVITPEGGKFDGRGIRPPPSADTREGAARASLAEPISESPAASAPAEQSK